MTPREVSQVVWANAFAAEWIRLGPRETSYERMDRARRVANEASSAANEMALHEQRKDPEGEKGWWGK